MSNAEDEKKINRMVILPTSYFDTATSLDENTFNNNKIKKKKQKNKRNKIKVRKEIKDGQENKNNDFKEKDAVKERFIEKDIEK